MKILVLTGAESGLGAFRERSTQRKKPGAVTCRGSGRLRQISVQIEPKLKSNVASDSSRDLGAPGLYEVALRIHAIADHL